MSQLTKMVALSREEFSDLKSGDTVYVSKSPGGLLDHGYHKAKVGEVFEGNQIDIFLEGGEKRRIEMGQSLYKPEGKT